jgi:NAD(P)H-dependent FMN reductase
MKKIHIPVVLATAREGRESEKVAKFIHKKLTDREDVDTEIVDVKDHLYGETVPSWIEDDRTKKWKSIVEESDAIIFVIPEYNHSYPGEFKILFDGAFKEYDKKPLAAVGVSSGGFGGTRVIEEFLHLVTATSGVPVPASLNISNVADSFTEEGSVNDEHIIKRTGKMIDTVLWYANKFKN